MPQAEGLKVVVTGAGGFVGAAVTARIASGGLGKIAELRLNDLRAIGRPGTVEIHGSFADRAVREQLVAGGIDVLFHLASLPGGASERDPVLGRSVNLDGSIALFDEAARSGTPKVVYTSSIAALGRHDHAVSQRTALRPVGSYGTHKAMLEYYLADLTRRGLVDGRSVRLAGIVARPRDAYAGFATAWMSDLFHAARERRAITIPARADARVWLQSIDTATDNIVHAATVPATDLASHRAWTLPASVVRIGDLVAALSRRTGHTLRVGYGDGPHDHPPLDASDALALGFVEDGGADALAAGVLAQLERDERLGVAAPEHIP